MIQDFKFAFPQLVTAPAFSIAAITVLALNQQPGVAAAGIITNVPLSGDDGKTAVTPKGYVPPAGQSLHGHYSYCVSGEYFAALGIPLREGRFLTSADAQRPKRLCRPDRSASRGLVTR